MNNLKRRKYNMANTVLKANSISIVFGGLKAVDNFDWYEMPGNIKRASNTNKLVLPFKYNETRLFRLVK